MQLEDQSGTAGCFSAEMLPPLLLSLKQRAGDGFAVVPELQLALCVLRASEGMGRSCSSKGHLLDSPLTCEWEKSLQQSEARKEVLVARFTNERHGLTCTYSCTYGSRVV